MINSIATLCNVIKNNITVMLLGLVIYTTISKSDFEIRKYKKMKNSGY